MRKSPRIAFLVPTLDSGGIETYLIRFLADRGSSLEATVVVRSRRTGDLEEEYRNLGVPIHFMPLGYRNPVRWIRYYRFFSMYHFDAICDFNANFAGIPVWLAKRAGIRKRVVFYRQGKDHFRRTPGKRIYNRWVNHLVYRHATAILSNSAAAFEVFFPYREPADPKFRVIPNGIDLRQYNGKVDKTEVRRSLGIPARAYVIGHVGRNDKMKNHDTIFRVTGELIRRDPEIYLVLCGRGTEEFGPRADAEGISGNVRLLGYRSDVPVLIAAFDLFYFPSLSEGQPNALLEAMAAGIPVVASDIAPIRECLPGSHWKYLFPPTAVEQHIGLIERLRSNGTIETGTLRFHAREHFDSRENFGMFAAILTEQQPDP